MTGRRWYTAAGACLVVAAVFAGCTAFLARDVPPVLDSGGQSEAQAMGRPLREQFTLVEERYLKFNDLVADTQREFYAGEWIDAGASNAQMTMRGSAFTGALNGEATEANSYYLTRFWRLENTPNAEIRLGAVAAHWKRKGWKVLKSRNILNPEEIEVAMSTSDGTQIALDMARGGINLTAYSGVYWGDRAALANAIWNIQVTERIEDSDWRPENFNAEGDGLIRPGEYPPFPGWRAVALEDRIEESPFESDELGQ